MRIRGVVSAREYGYGALEETSEDAPVVVDEAAAKNTTVGGVEIDEVQCLSLLVCEIYKPKDECEVHILSHIICSSFLFLNLHLIIVYAH